MLIKRTRGWEIPEREATPESVFAGRRSLLKAMGFAGMAGLMAGAAGGPLGRALAAETAGGADPTADLYPAQRNMRYRVERPITPEDEVTTYNNFYEFGSHKNVWRAAQKLPIRPWSVKIDGMVEQEIETDFDTLVRKMPLEERVYRFRCVEAWAMTVPWTGFPLKALVDYARPQAGAKYLRMETFQDSEVAPGSGRSGIPGPISRG